MGRATSRPRPTRTTARRTDASAAERGAAALLVVAVLAVTFAMVLGTARVGDAVLRRHRAQLVADVAALAAVGREATAADRVARANGAMVRAVTVADGGTVVVTVELDGARATAAAAPGG